MNNQIIIETFFVSSFAVCRSHKPNLLAGFRPSPPTHQPPLYWKGYHNNVVHKANLCYRFVSSNKTILFPKAITRAQSGFGLGSANFSFCIINWVWCHYVDDPFQRASQSGIDSEPVTNPPQNRLCCDVWNGTLLKLNHCEFIIHLINCYWVIIVKRIVDFSTRMLFRRAGLTIRRDALDACPPKPMTLSCRVSRSSSALCIIVSPFKWNQISIM